MTIAGLNEGHSSINFGAAQAGACQREQNIHTETQPIQQMQLTLVTIEQNGQNSSAHRCKAAECAK
jgi:hypothetical protein